jgi:poly-beta-hydroxyalkanoate depolymerase
MVTRVLVAVAVALIGPLATVQTAQADTNDTKFIALLNSEGITDHISPSHAIEAAHTVCSKLEGGESPNQVATDVLNNSTMPAYHSGYFVGAAIKVYCPQFTPEETPANG